MQFMILLRRDTERFDADDFAPRLAAETEQARHLYATGVVRQIWHRGDTGGACLLFEADDELAAQKALHTLPLVAAGMLEVAAFVPLRPYAGFGPQSVRA